LNFNQNLIWIAEKFEILKRRCDYLSIISKFLQNKADNKLFCEKLKNLIYKSKLLKNQPIKVSFNKRFFQNFYIININLMNIPGITLDIDGVLMR